MFGVRTRDTMASEAAWVAGNRAGGLVLLAACAVWVMAAIYLPRPYVKPIGIAAVLVSVGILFISQGWSF
jgi:sterol desaturase/sphingolipid hydroxylase (fatty acid hydroxylase superfamily)